VYDKKPGEDKERIEWVPHPWLACSPCGPPWACHSCPACPACPASETSNAT
jgi:hypothetical protein